MNLDQSFPSAQDFANYGVVDTDNTEVVRQRLWDYSLYPTAGLLILPLFQIAQGGGITSTNGAAVGSVKTITDTNMQLQGQLPQGKAYWIETIEVVFLPGSSAAANTYAPSLPEATGAAVAGQTQFADVEVIYQSGELQVNISSKNYLDETPLGSFPPKTFSRIDGAMASTVAATFAFFGNAKRVGRPYIVEPGIVLQSGVNFDVTLKWPGLVATPSGFNGRIGVILDGYLLRARQ